MKKIFFLFLLTSLGATLYAGTMTAPQTKYIEANQNYEKGDYEKAEGIYLTLTQQGFQSPGLYYNLGNIYYKKGERGKSILWFERALALAPRDADIQFNLNLARAHLKDEHTPWTERVLTFFNMNEITGGFLFFSGVFFILLGLFCLNAIPNISGVRTLLWMSGVMFFLTGVWFGLRFSYNAQEKAIVIAPTGEVRNGPGADYAVGFTIPEGSSMIVLEKRPEWIQIGIPEQSLKGWIQAKDMALIRQS